MSLILNQKKHIIFHFKLYKPILVYLNINLKKKQVKNRFLYANLKKPYVKILSYFLCNTHKKNRTKALLHSVCFMSLFLFSGIHFLLFNRKRNSTPRTNNSMHMASQ